MSYYQKSIQKITITKILEQMENTFCKIEGKDTIGYFCYFNYQNKNIPAIIINDDINISENKTINVSINNVNKIIKLGDKIYRNKENKISIIEIKENKKDKIKFLEFDDLLYEKEPEMLYHKELIYIIQYINQDDIFVSYSSINDINKNEIIYNCDIKTEAKYSLIFNLSNNKLIGIHKCTFNNYNKGKIFNFIINGFKYKIKNIK